MNQSRDTFFCKYKQKQSKNANLEAITKRLNCNIMQKIKLFGFLRFSPQPRLLHQALVQDLKTKAIKINNIDNQFHTASLENSTTAAPPHSFGDLTLCNVLCVTLLHISNIYCFRTNICTYFGK